VFVNNEFSILMPALPFKSMKSSNGPKFVKNMLPWSATILVRFILRRRTMTACGLLALLNL